RLLQGREEAEDVLVETYSEVWRGAKRFMGNARVTTWIIGIARNLAMNTWRKVKTHDSIEDHPHLSSRTVSDAEPFDRQRLIDKAMAGLSTKHREVLDLVFLQEFNYQEVSEVLNIPVNTVKTRVFYAKGAIKETLSRMGVRRDDI
ncbi:MAG: RNA polymerase sigma factor, partial [Thermodesulfobacteriota bacterium]